MSDAIVDTNALVDVLSRDPVWFGWSLRAMRRTAAEGRLFLNQVVYAELYAGGRPDTDIEQLVGRYVVREDLPWEAARRAGEAFRSYRHRGGPRTTPLPDFYVGAHAEVRGYAVITRDPRRFRTYFPSVALITP